MKGKAVSKDIKIVIDKPHAEFTINAIKDLNLFIDSLIMGHSIGNQFGNPVLLKMKAKIEYLNNIKRKLESEL